MGKKMYSTKHKILVDLSVDLPEHSSLEMIISFSFSIVMANL